MSSFAVDPLEPPTPDAEPTVEDSLFHRHIGTVASGSFPLVELERLTNEALVRLDLAKRCVRLLHELSDLWLKVTTRRRSRAEFATAWEAFDRSLLQAPWADPYGWPGLLQAPYTDRFPAHPDGIRIGKQRFPNAHAAAGQAGPRIDYLWLAAHADLGMVARSSDAAPEDPLPLILAFFERFEEEFSTGQLDELFQGVVREYRGERALLQAPAAAVENGMARRGPRWSRGVNIADIIRFFGLRQKNALEDLEKLKIPYTVISRERIHVGLQALDPEAQLQFQNTFGGPNAVRA